MLIRISKLLGVTTDYLLGMETVPRLNTEGLPPSMVAHLMLLIDDYRMK